MIFITFIYVSCNHPDSEVSKLKEACQIALTILEGSKSEFNNALFELNQIKSGEKQAQTHLNNMKRIQSALETTIKKYDGDKDSGDYIILINKKNTADNEVQIAQNKLNEFKRGIVFQNTKINIKGGAINTCLQNHKNAQTALNNYLNKNK